MDDRPPAVSIALAMRNSAATIDAALRSVALQTFQDWELLVFDDGSTDGSVQCVRRFHDPRIRLFSDHAHRGLAARLNQAIDAANGRYYARMDADDIAYPERIERQFAYLESHLEIDLLGANMMVFEGDGEPVGIQPALETHEQICARPYSRFFLPHPTWMGRVEWFRKWRYDESYRRAQDQNLLQRAYSSSRFAGLPEPLVGYREEFSSVGKSWQSRWYSTRSILALARREIKPVRGVYETGMQGARALVDTLAISAGMARTVLRHRALPFAPHDAARWVEVWAACRPEPS